MTTPTIDDPVYAAADLLFRARHQLPADILRTLHNTWSCASAARYGDAQFWAEGEEADFSSTHDTVDCEAEPSTTNRRRTT